MKYGTYLYNKNFNNPICIFLCERPDKGTIVIENDHRLFEADPAKMEALNRKTINDLYSAKIFRYEVAIKEAKATIEAAQIDAEVYNKTLVEWRKDRDNLEDKINGMKVVNELTKNEGVITSTGELQKELDKLKNDINNTQYYRDKANHVIRHHKERIVEYETEMKMYQAQWDSIIKQLEVQENENRQGTQTVG